MSAFKFSLQPVLKHRTDLEEDKKNSYHQAKQMLQIEEEKVKKLTEKISELNASLEKTGMINVTVFNHVIHYREQLNQELKLQKNKQKESTKQVEIAQQNLLQARVDVQVLEKMKERQQDQYIQQINYEEAKLLDELACISYGRT